MTNTIILIGLALMIGAVATLLWRSLGVVSAPHTTWLKTHWRTILARAPLPMLALAASWGVYSFARLYVPMVVAIIQAAAFELTYIGLAITRDLSVEQRQRATHISIGAVVVSVVYNSIDGLFARNPAWLVGLPWGYEIAGAVLHGAPLAIVAYLVADLLLHSDASRPPHDVSEDAPAQPHAGVLSYARPAHAEPVHFSSSVSGEMHATGAHHVCPGCGASLSQKQYAAARRWGHCTACKKPGIDRKGGSRKAL